MPRMPSYAGSLKYGSEMNTMDCRVGVGEEEVGSLAHGCEGHDQWPGMSGPHACIAT